MYKRTEIGFGHMATVPTKFEADQATGVSAAVRYRESWGMRMLTLSGPPDSLTEARRMAMARIAASQTRQRQTPATASASPATGGASPATGGPKLLNPQRVWGVQVLRGCRVWIWSEPSGKPSFFL